MRISITDCALVAIPAAVARFDDLIVTVSHSVTDGYEVLIEVDTDEGAAVVPVSVGTAAETLGDVLL